MSDTEVLAFVEYVRNESLRIGLTAKRNPLEASQAARKKRELLGLPEPDPDVDYDEDYHADGTERLNGEPRREKGEAFSATLDLASLSQEQPTGTARKCCPQSSTFPWFSLCRFVR